MKTGQRLWNKSELTLAVNLYCKIPFGRLHRLNPEIIDFANLIGRTPSSVAWKLVNFASLDPSLKARGVKGASNASKLDKEVWDEFFNDWGSLSYESEKLLAKLKNVTLEQLSDMNTEELFIDGKEREQIIKARVNQSFFRNSILAAYNNTCCITGINQPELLIAGHIRPWGIDTNNRMNPRNGLAMNPLHDKAFEIGYITITPEYIIHVSPTILKQENKHQQILFTEFHQKKMILPSRFLPDKEFLKYHNEERFRC